MICRLARILSECIHTMCQSTHTPINMNIINMMECKPQLTFTHTHSRCYLDHIIYADRFYFWEICCNCRYFCLFFCFLIHTMPFILIRFATIWLDGLYSSFSSVLRTCICNETVGISLWAYRLRITVQTSTLLSSIIFSLFFFFLPKYVPCT